MGKRSMRKSSFDRKGRKRNRSRMTRNCKKEEWAAELKEEK